MKQTFVQDISRQLQSAVFSSGLATKLICLFCIIGYGLSFSPQCVRFLAVIPGRVMPPNFWIWFVEYAPPTSFYKSSFLFILGHLLHIVLSNYIFGILLLM
jgi:hypothetical protein